MALVAASIFGDPSGVGLLGPALASVLAIWFLAEVIAFPLYVAFSLAPLSQLFAASLRATAAAMWLAPGALLLADRSPLAVAIGLAAVVHSTHLLASTRAPRGPKLTAAVRPSRREKRRLFRYRPEPRAYFSQTLPMMLGAVVFQLGLIAFALDDPLLGAFSFAAVTAIWTSVSVARDAAAARMPAWTRYSAIGVLVIALSAASITAMLMQSDASRGSQLATGKKETTANSDIIQRALHRLAHLRARPERPRPAGDRSHKVVTAQLVDPNPAKEGIPGLVLRPDPRRRHDSLIMPGSRFAGSHAPSIVIPFTGEYHLFRASSGKLPSKATMDVGTPLENAYATTNGEPMRTVAVQTFEPPIDLTHCAKLVVSLSSAETIPVLAAMELVSEGRVEDGGTDTVAMKARGEGQLAFRVPAVARPLLVEEIWFSFQRTGPDADKSVRIAIDSITLLPRGRYTPVQFGVAPGRR